MTNEEVRVLGKAKPPKQKFVPSAYQQAVFDKIESGEGTLVVDAKAGSGKTTTTVRGLKYLDPNLDITFLAFNKNIATELGKKAPSYVQCSTIHSLSYANYRQGTQVDGKIKVDSYKMKGLYESVWERPDRYAHQDDKELHYMMVQNTTKVISLVKNTLTDWNDLERVRDLTYNYGLDVDPDIEQEVIERASLLIDEGLGIRDVIDFDDMIHMPLVLNLPHKKFDFLAVDEAQDLNSAQIEFTLRSINGSGRIMAVGDPYQSIYFWRGADSGAMGRIIRETDAEVLPLSITYRCPRLVTELAQQFVPGLEARENAPDGVVANIKEWDIPAMAKDGDMILCRVNAPLISIAFQLIRKGIKAVVRGRDIGKKLAEVARKVAKKATTMEEVFALLHEFEKEENTKAGYIKRERPREARYAMIEDKYFTLNAIAENVDTPDQFPFTCEKIFGDDTTGVVLSSVHRAKGLEADRVFIVKPELMPHPRAKGEEQLQQEHNIKYVAITRSLNELYFAHK